MSCDVATSVDTPNQAIKGPGHGYGNYLTIIRWLSSELLRKIPFSDILRVAPVPS